MYIKKVLTHSQKILSTAHVLAAVFRAINDRENHRMKSANVHSEIVFSLNPSNNVSQ
jgi:EKC/KEOPS complex subunit CGI121/TPRKB